MEVPDAGEVASLHIHPKMPGEPLASCDTLALVAGKGIVEELRYFGRKNSYGSSSRRHVSLIEREQIAEHAAALGASIEPGRVRSNIETVGVNLQELVGWEVAIGEAVLLFYEPRSPCSKMDKICQGLRALMENARQGVMAEVIQSGRVRVGDTIRRLSSRIRKGGGISAV